MALLNIAFLGFIIKTAIITLMLLAGFALLTTSNSKWERFIGKLMNIRDLEITPNTLLPIRISGVIVIGLSIWLLLVFFVFKSEGA